MPSSTRSSITLSDVGLTWPDGTTALAGITGAFGAGRTGVVGLNGSGKSTLLRLIAGELRPSTGHIATTAPVTHIPQTLPLQVEATVADLLGVGDQLLALRAIEAGDASAHHFDVLGDRWDVETRAAEALRDAGLPSIELDRRVGLLSGGEALLVAIAGLRLRAAPIVLLDEPTNNLDRAARARLSGLVDGWPGTLVVVSHDATLLDQMDNTAELHDGRLTVFGGPYSAWREHLEEEQAAAARAERAADQVVRTEERQRAEAEIKLARRARYARTDFVNKRRPKIVMQQRKTEAQVSAGRLRTEFDGKVQVAREALSTARARVRDDAQIRIDLPDPDVPAGRRIAEVHGTNRSFVIQGRGALKRELVTCLRTGRALRVPRARARQRATGHVTPEVMISRRPAEADDRAIPGHWEGDLIIGTDRSAIGTLVERTTRFTVLLHLPRMAGYEIEPRVKNGPALTGYGAEAMRDAITARIGTLPDQLRRSLTWDRGKELARHAQLTIDTNLAVYFADPHSSWQRGTNENTNGLLRQYFPQGTDLSRWTADDLEAVAAALNGDPARHWPGRPPPRHSTNTYSRRYELVLRRPVESGQYLAIGYTERLAEIGAVTSVGSRGDSYDNAAAESLIGLFKTELIRRRGPWRGLDQVELATLEWVDWFNNRRLHSACGDVPPVEYEREHYRQIATLETPETAQPSLQ